MLNDASKIIRAQRLDLVDTRQDAIDRGGHLGGVRSRTRETACHGAEKTSAAKLIAVKTKSRKRFTTLNPPSRLVSCSGDVVAEMSREGVRTWN